jgi:hypothetical protein
LELADLVGIFSETQFLEGLFPGVLCQKKKIIQNLQIKLELFKKSSKSLKMSFFRKTTKRPIISKPTPENPHKRKIPPALSISQFLYH